MKRWILCRAGFALAASVAAMPAQAETLSIVSMEPAGVDAAATVQSIVVLRFSGREGPRLSSQIERRLLDVRIDGEQYFEVVSRQRARDRDTLIDGSATYRWEETDYTERRRVCTEEDENGRCTKREQVELDCIRLTVSVQAETRLIRSDGPVIWSDRFPSTESVGYCPEFDDEPRIAPMVETAIANIADEVRAALAPTQFQQDVRIMERRRGLSDDASRTFRDAVRMTKTDQREACAMFASLEADAPTQPSLVFNLGLCAEQAGDYDTAISYYRAALADRTSDDEAEVGLARISANLAAERQLDRREEAGTEL